MKLFFRVLFGIALAAFVIFLLTGLFDYLYVRFIVGAFEQGLGAINWVNPHFGKAVISLIGGILWLVALRLFPFIFGSVRRVLVWMVVVPLFLATITHGILAFATWGDLFDSLGKSSLFYGIDDQNRVEYFNRSGTHPKTGVTLLPVTPDNVREVEMRRHAIVQEITNPETNAWFAPGSSKPMLWYVKREDGLHFYNLPGFDPATAIKLLPVTAAIKAQYDASGELKKGQAHFHEVANPEPDVWFSATSSKPVLWYGNREDGLHFFNAPGFDPATSKELQPVTYEIKAAYALEKEAKLKQAAFREIVDPDPDAWFTTNTSKPRLWYAKREDGYHLFNGPGFDPTTSQVLKPATPEVKLQYEAARKLREKQAEQTEQETENARQVALLKSLWIPLPSEKGKTNVAFALVADADSREQSEWVDAKLPVLFKAAVPSMAFNEKFFQPAFIQKGYFDRAFQGDCSFLKQGGVFDSVDYVLLCKAKVAPPAKPSIEGVSSAHLALKFCVIARDLKVVDSGVEESVGAGLSDRESLDRAIEILVEKKASRIFKAINNPEKQ